MNSSGPGSSGHIGSGSGPAAPAEKGPFRADVLEQDEMVRVVLTGELDLAASARLEKLLEELHAVHPPRLVFDLRRLTFLDATGLRVILEEHDRARRGEIELTLIKGPPGIQRVFDVAGCENLPFSSA